MSVKLRYPLLSNSESKNKQKGFSDHENNFLKSHAFHSRRGYESPLNLPIYYSSKHLFNICYVPLIMLALEEIKIKGHVFSPQETYNLVDIFYRGIRPLIGIYISN